MVLVDTSVWIRFLAGRSPYAAELDRLLGLDEVTGHELVYGELRLTVTSSRSSVIAICMVAAWVGSTFTSWPPLLYGDCSYGRSTHASPPWLASLV
jgi:predicted nucleic acid-binding protein